MRVIAGSARGSRLTVPAGAHVRPTADRPREALMSALGGFFDGHIVLDLCAGSGAVGIELLSRGCGHVYFVEPAEHALSALRENIIRTHFEDKATVLQSDATCAIQRLAADKLQFDIIFIDPPWKLDAHGELLNAVIAHDLLRPGGEIIVERSADDGSAVAPPTHWHVLWRRRYGRCMFERVVATES